MDTPMLGSSPFKIRPSEFLPAPLSPTTPFSPPCILPKFVLHGLSSKSKFLAIAIPLKANSSKSKFLAIWDNPNLGLYRPR